MGISSGYYPKAATLTQPWNRESVSVALDSLGLFEPSKTVQVSASEHSPLTRSDILAGIAESAVPRGDGQAPSFLICYYVGHMFSSSSGELAVVLGDVTRKQLDNAEGAPWGGNNLSPDVFVRIDELHGALRETGVPFVLIVDGCMTNDRFLNEISGLGFAYSAKYGGEADYFGPAEVMTGEPKRITASHAGFGARHSYIGSNPIIFAAKPGTFARARSHPWIVGAPMVGPRAWAIAFWVRRNLAISRDASLKDVVERIAGWRGIGEISMEGAISWGDFGIVDRILERIRPGGFRGLSNTREAVRRRLSPGVGTIEDIALTGQADDLLVMTKNWDETIPKFRWDLWRYRGEGSSELLEGDLMFAKMESGNGGFWIYDENEDPRMRWKVLGTSAFQSVVEGEIIDKLFQSEETDSMCFSIEDAVFGEPGDQLFLAKADLASLVDQFDLTAYEAIAPWNDGAWILVSSERDGRVFKRKGDGIDFLQKLRFPPREVITRDQVAYFFSLDNRSVARWDGATTWEEANLLTEEDDLIAPFEFWKGGVAVRGRSLFVATRDEILEIDLDSLDWMDHEELH